MNQSAFLDEAVAHLDNLEETYESHPFYHFEPWDVAPRPQEVLDIATEYEVELDPEGEPYQTERFLEFKKTITATVASNQSGKSIQEVIDTIIMLTGEIPYALRYAKGEDTGIKRKINQENVERFGLNEKGDCGNIIGVGKYPKEKIAPGRGNRIWICTYKQARDEFWIPFFKRLMPEELLDKSQGTDGFAKIDSLFYLRDDCKISFITYEQGYKRVEAMKVWKIILDEEPPDRRFYVSALEHCKYLSLVFTPINGLTWTHKDIFIPAANGENPNIRVFHCCQFDSPYQDNELVKSKLKNYKPYEIKARLFGIFSAMEGKPYYEWSITTRFINKYIPRHFLEMVYPKDVAESTRDILKVQMLAQEVFEEGPDVWHIYEKYNPLCAYWISCDVGKGHEDPAQAQDKSAAYILRLPLQEELDDGFPLEPIMVGSLYTTARNFQFARLVLYQAIHMNYSLIAPESTGEDGASFLTEIRDYPFLFKMNVINQRTKKTTENIGFDTNRKTRTPMFDLVGDWINGHEEGSKIYHLPLLEEMNKIIVGKKGRPDHAKNETSDCVVAKGIGLWVFQHARSQIKNNSHFFRFEQTNPKKAWERYGTKAKESRPILGSREGMDRRSSRLGYLSPEGRHARSRR